jgi:hypothetical protein
MMNPEHQIVREISTEVEMRLSLAEAEASRLSDAPGQRKGLIHGQMIEMCSWFGHTKVGLK